MRPVAPPFPLLLLAPVVLLHAGPALAGSAVLPPVYARIAIEADRTIDCSTTNRIWAPNGSLDQLVFRATVLDGQLWTPVADCSLSLALSGKFDRAGQLGSSAHGSLCGPAIRGAVRDEAGAAAFPITGGGCGVFALYFALTAVSGDPPVPLWSGGDTLCAKSPDINGSGQVNFTDSFIFAGWLHSGHGYFCDLRFCSVEGVCNFRDTFLYSQALASGAACTAGVLWLSDATLGVEIGECPLHPEW